MKLSNRLNNISELIRYKTVADIGTDHCYLPIFLAKKGMFDRIIATDVNENPLKRAKQNLKIYGLDDIIELRLGYGLTPVKAFEVECAVISGMGGCLIMEILEASLPVMKSLKQLILSPQKNPERVMEFLHSNNFEADEFSIIDAGKRYVIFDAQPREV